MNSSNSNRTFQHYENRNVTSSNDKNFDSQPPSTNELVKRSSTTQCYQNIGWIFAYDEKQKRYFIYSTDRKYGTFHCVRGKNPLAYVGGFVHFEAELITDQCFHFNVRKLYCKVNPDQSRFPETRVEDNVALMKAVVWNRLEPVVHSQWTRPKRRFTNVDVCEELIQDSSVPVEGYEAEFKLEASNFSKMVCWIRFSFHPGLKTVQCFLERVCEIQKPLEQMKTVDVDDHDTQAVSFPEDTNYKLQHEKSHPVTRSQYANLPPRYSEPPVKSQELYVHPQAWKADLTVSNSESALSQSTQLRPPTSAGKLRYGDRSRKKKSKESNAQSSETLQKVEDEKSRELELRSQSEYSSSLWLHAIKEDDNSNQSSSSDVRSSQGDGERAENLIQLALLTRITVNENIKKAISEHDPEMMFLIENCIADLSEKTKRCHV